MESKERQEKYARAWGQISVSESSRDLPSKTQHQGQKSVSELLGIITEKELNIKEKPEKKGFKISNLALEDKQKLVGAFAWLIKQDKKQNPALYQLKRTTND